MANWLLDPLWEGPTRAGRALGDVIDYPTIDRSPTEAMFEGFLGGAAEGAGSVLSDMTSPLSIVSYLAGAGGLKKLRDLKKTADLARTAGKPKFGSLATQIERASLPEFVPVGGEEVANTLRRARRVEDIASRARPVADEIYETAAKRQGMGLPRTDAPGKLVNKRQWPYDEVTGTGGFDIYELDWPGHPSHMSTITLDMARKLGIIK